jgi:hypothetical protein
LEVSNFSRDPPKTLEGHDFFHEKALHLRRPNFFSLVLKNRTMWIRAVPLGPARGRL